MSSNEHEGVVSEFKASNLQPANTSSNEDDDVIPHQHWQDSLEEDQKRNYEDWEKYVKDKKSGDGVEKVPWIKEVNEHGFFLDENGEWFSDIGYLPSTGEVEVIYNLDEDLTATGPMPFDKKGRTLPCYEAIFEKSRRDIVARMEQEYFNEEILVPATPGNEWNPILIQRRKDVPGDPIIMLVAKHEDNLGGSVKLDKLLVARLQDLAKRSYAYPRHQPCFAHPQGSGFNWSFYSGERSRRAPRYAYVADVPAEFLKPETQIQNPFRPSDRDPRDDKLISPVIARIRRLAI
ncbi:hypothetical protein K505DRAFT_342782 [Melanomma pulvis-pyrius CBS 109.77]|uniref:Uncharacterized protein n=1 Tax=Melanomma pulvis-pyrius CBS 109.77 TaxID=1314802 RepID=A0A6A6WTV8_9PLEO|nr:hypothetical protein K505DRAFT_342782 [Melanomma pulvis-pyrius CBS 109.77]